MQRPDGFPESDAEQRSAPELAHFRIADKPLTMRRNRGKES